MILAVLYLRMSSDQQATSIADQRRAVTEWAAKNGYKIVSEYVDSGVSGWRDDRAEFQRLIADASSGRFQAVLCWDQDRFSRFPPLEANHYWFLLDKAGVHLATVNQGRIDWTSLAGWLTASISQHGKAEYCRDLGRNVARGQYERKIKGDWIGKAPIGYSLESGRLAIGSPAEVATVRRIFAERVRGTGTKTIATNLNRDGIPTPRGLKWSSQAVRHVLQRDAYLGHVVIGKWARGKYARVVQGQKVIENAHPALVDQETWDAVRAMQLVRHKKRHNGDGQGAALAGLLYCGDCGGQLYSQRFLTRGTANYLCGTYHSHGDCHCNRVDQEPTLRLVIAKVRHYLGLCDIPRLKKAIARKLAARQIPTVDRANIRRQVASIDHKLNNAAERIVSVDAAVVPAIQAKMVDLQQQRAGLEAALAAKPVQNITVESALGALLNIDRVLQTGKPAEIRAALSRVIERIDLNFEAWKQTGNGRKWRRPVGGSIKPRTNAPQQSELICHIASTRIPLSRSELANCYRQRPWNSTGGTA